MTRSVPLARRAVAAWASFLSVFLAVGCAWGGTSGGDDDVPELQKQPSGGLSGTVTVWSWDVAADALQRLAPAFERAHPGVDVEVVDVGYDNAYDKISVGLQAGSGLPDVVTVESEQMENYATTFPDGFTPLTEVAAQYRDEFASAKWESAIVGDSLYSLPWDVGTAGLFYRRDYFDAAGIRAQDVHTWDDLIEAGEAIKRETGKMLLAMDITGGDSLLMMMLQQRGQSYFTDSGSVAVSSAAAVEAAQTLREMADRDLLYNARGWDGLVTATKEGKVAAQPIGVWWTGTLQTEMPELSGKFGVMPLPSLGPESARASNNGGSSLAIPAESDNAQAAWEFVEFALASRSNQASMMQKEGLFPAYLPALDSSVFQRGMPYFGGQRVLDLFATLTEQIPSVTYTADHSKADDIMTDAVAGFLVGDADPAMALQDAAAQIAAATGRDVAS